MPRFRLDLRFTEAGLRLSTAERDNIRNNHAIPFVTDPHGANLKIIHPIEDRPEGPVWIVEGEESGVKMVLERFNNPPNTPNGRGPTVRATATIVVS